MLNSSIYKPRELQALNKVSHYTSDFKLDELDIDDSIKSKLEESQIHTVKLLAITPLLVLEKTGFQIDISVKLIKQAQDFLENNSAKTKVKNWSAYSGITTGCQRLDALLKGGIKPGQVIQVYGNSSTGKTQLAHQLCINVLASYESGGLEGQALFLDTDGTFRPERIRGMILGLNLDVDYRYVLWNIFVARAYTSYHQMRFIRLASKFKLIKKLGIKLLVIDSMMGHFRSEYGGGANISKRQKKVEIHLQDLKNLQKSNKELAILFTNQVTYDPVLEKNKPCGGGVVSYYSDIQIELSRGWTTERFAKIVEAPYLSNEKAKFRITSGGIQD